MKLPSTMLTNIFRPPQTKFLVIYASPVRGVILLIHGIFRFPHSRLSDRVPLPATYRMAQKVRDADLSN